jgi:hypothetical protein
MKVLICGGRFYEDRDVFFHVMDGIHNSSKVTKVIQGGADGADHLAWVWACTRDIPVITYEAEWGKYGAAAGPIRNTRMLEEGKPDLVIAFPGNYGTADMVRKSERANLPIVRVNEEGKISQPNIKG